jgi:hypothetical protein
MVAVSTMVPLVRDFMPPEFLLMLSILATLPSFASGSLTRLFGTFYCFDTIFSPLRLYIQDEISDHAEVRYFIIGILLSITYLTTAAALGYTNSIALSIVIAAGAFGVLTLGNMLIWTHGPWDIYFKCVPVGTSNRNRQHAISRFVEYTSWFAVQQLLFRLNRVVRSVIAFFSSFDQTKDIQINSAGPYVYKDLDGGRKTIRLLKIQRWRHNQEIQCQLEEVPLENLPFYEAASYVWGDPSPTKSILVDGRRLAITKSAYDIIQKRRSYWHETVIWIDQICINQKNDQEKNSQVQIMNVIYKEAARVIAFLGESGDAHSVQLFLSTLHYLMQGLGCSEEMLKTIFLANPQWKSISNFFGNPWFRRVWIVQEAAFAKKLILFYGDICIDSESLSRAVAVLSNRHMIASLGDPIAMLEGQDFDNCYENAMDGFHNADTMLEFRGDVDYQRAFPLSMVLQSCISFEATDPRDKVYALLGLTTDDSKSAIIPEYQKGNSARTVYITAMRYVLEKAANPLDALSVAGIGIDRLMNDLPSWVPDWSYATQPQPLDVIYSAGTVDKAAITFDPTDASILHLDGTQFDRVKHLSTVYDVRHSPNAAEQYSYYKRWYAKAEALARNNARDPYHNDEPILEAFIRTVIGNRASYKREKPSAAQCYSDYAALEPFLNNSRRLMTRLRRTRSKVWRL